MTGSIATMLEGVFSGTQLHGGLPVRLQGSFSFDPLVAHTDFTIATNITGRITQSLYRMPGPTGYDPQAFRADEDADHLPGAGAGSLRPPLIPPEVLQMDDMQTPSVAEAKQW